LRLEVLKTGLFCEYVEQAVEKGQKLGQIAFISKNLSMSEGLIKV
jgi:hypothetical protein